MCVEMMQTIFILCILAGSALHAEQIHPRIGRRAEMVKPQRTWKMGKNFSYAVIGVVLKALLLIKLALAKLAILGNISIMLSKLSLILSLFLTLGKYFGGISKMLKLKSLGYDDRPSYHYPAHEDHGNSYIT